MDLEVQGRIKELAESLGRANLMVVLGAPNVDSSLIQFETVTRGDPTYSGPLAGVELGLDTYHIFEPVMKAVVDAEKYEELFGTLELALEGETIVQAPPQTPERGGLGSELISKTGGLVHPRPLIFAACLNRRRPGHIILKARRFY